MSAAGAMSTRRTTSPLIVMPGILAECVAASAGSRAGLTPPALPRPPACTWAFTHTAPPPPRLAPAPGMPLGFYDHCSPAAQPRGDGAGLVGRGGHLAGRDRDAVASQDIARLVLVQVHAGSVVIVVPASPASAARPCDSSAMIARRPPARTKAAAASTLGRMLRVPSCDPASR